VKFRFPTAEERHARRRAKFLDFLKKSSKWHKWFVWYPVRLTIDQHEIVWLCFVYRRVLIDKIYGQKIHEWQYVESTLDILKITGGENKDQ
jgi:hypothetical protein